MGSDLKVLIAEDSEDDALLVVHELRRGGFEVAYERVDTADRLRAEMDRGWDIVIADYSMPGLSGLEALGIIRRSGSDLPAIVVSGVIGEDQAVTVMKAGACDYIAKTNLSRLVPAVRRELAESEARRRHRLAEMEKAGAVAALRESEERLRTIFESAMDGMFLMDMDGRYKDVNASGCSMFGYTRSEMLSLDASSLFFERDQADRLLACRHRWGKGAFVPELRMRKKDGAEIWVDVSITPLGVSGGTLALCVKRDITARKRAEEESCQMQARLIHANKMASLGTLASGVAHEINNPNNFILFNSTLLGDAWRDSLPILSEYYERNGDFSLGGLPFSEMRGVVPELLGGIADGSRRIKAIVDGLKDFSRSDRGAMEGEFDVNAAVMSSVAILGSQISMYTDEFSVDCAEGLPPVRGSAQKIEQVVMNLVINSLQALGDRGRGVRVSTCCDADSGTVVIRVADEGCGMTQDLIGRVTEPFFTTRAESGGTGLGLSISYSIVREHGGSLELESVPGEGTTATVRLPAARRKAREK